jgi:hypothetical protein
VDTITLRQLEGTLREKAPDLKVLFKDESRLQKAVGYVLQPFTPEYMTDYTTTIGSTVYFPSKAFYEGRPDRSIITLSHEFVHVMDHQRDVLFKLKYLFPQVLVVVPVVVYAILAASSSWILALPVVGYLLALLFYKRSKEVFWGILGLSLLGTLVLGWLLTKWGILVLLGLAIVGPWPAPWRVYYELRGYGMNVAIEQWMLGRLPDDVRTAIVDQFVGPSYLYMSWDRTYITRSIEATRQQAQVGALQRDPPYLVVYDFLYSRRLLQSRA